MYVFEKPRYYILAHMLFGCIAVWVPWFGVAAILWQLGQYFANVRIFIPEGKIEHGNSIEHTGVKLAEIGAGFVIGLLIFYVLQKDAVDITA